MTELLKKQNIEGNRKHKDILFRLVFESKENLLDLYNAINGTTYQSADVLEVNTIENALFMGIKNDVSFLVEHTMNLYEHQSTKNENMPVRGLIYLSRQFENYIAEHNLNIYSSKLQRLPTPQYIIFYNGKSNEPDERILKLSDAFMKEGGCLECEARLLNINYGHNLELMEKCKRLEEYAIFIETIRNYLKKENTNVGVAIMQAVEECMGKGILEDILAKQKSEVLSMILSTFDRELYERELREEIREDLKEELREELREDLKEEVLCSQVKKKLYKGKTIEKIADELEENVELIREIVKNI